MKGVPHRDTPAKSPDLLPSLLASLPHSLPLHKPPPCAVGTRSADMRRAHSGHQPGQASGKTRGAPGPCPQDACPLCQSTRPGCAQVAAEARNGAFRGRREGSGQVTGAPDKGSTAGKLHSTSPSCSAFWIWAQPLLWVWEAPRDSCTPPGLPGSQRLLGKDSSKRAAHRGDQEHALPPSCLSRTGHLISTPNSR